MWHSSDCKDKHAGKLYFFFFKMLYWIFTVKKTQTLMESQSKSLFVGYLRGIRVLKKQYDGSKELRHGQYKKREGCWIPFLLLPISAPEATFAHFSTATNQNSAELHHCNLKIICHQINPLPHHSLTDCFPEVPEKCWRFRSLHAHPQTNFLWAALNSKCFLWHSDFSFLLQLQLPMPHKTLLPQ